MNTNTNMMIETKHLTRRYGTRVVVDDVNLQVKKGEIYGFLGPNGAGKTTTIRMLLGLIRPSAGEVLLFGRELSRHRMEVLGKIGSLVESPSYYGHLTGHENLQTIQKLLGLKKNRIDEVLETVRLTKDAHRPVKGYSLGMKQRLGIAAALLRDPEMVILDEPTNGLDPAGIHEVRQLILDMPRQHGITVLVSSHLLSEIDQVATQVGIINGGRLIFQDSIDVLRRESRPRLRVVTERPGAAQMLLRGQGHAAEIEAGALWLEGGAAENIGAINRELVLAGHTVTRIEEVKRSLEDIFLDLTGKDVSL
ncbi:ABC transporter ATP-binding protein [Tumebacillus sp. DT12]|uniref:ABC transporter ATP-binding protein n=1 Tax=Tumebacillus lacus TaxID=2995335 RepID=A0ABT3WY65_9BACL|nr:ABC transporter ATP-binding protein [Tumebacillus lacus]MCX7569612.1 ABC transporter ATP-binding protein [Tumebacillus lacus]